MGVGWSAGPSVLPACPLERIHKYVHFCTVKSLGVVIENCLKAVAKSAFRLQIAILKKTESDFQLKGSGFFMLLEALNGLEKVKNSF